MALTVNLGTYDGEPEVVDKDGLITWEEDGIDCVMLNTDFLNPVLKLLTTRKDFNYIEIPFYGHRMYFVESIEGLAGNHVILRCHVDVLYSYASGIKALTCFVHRNEDIEKWKRDIVDNAIIVSNRRVIYGTEFGDELVNDTGEYILGTIGKTQ